MNDKEYEMYKQLYLNGKSLRWISENYHVNRNSLSNKLKADNVIIKGNNPGQERRYKTEVDEYFFEKESSEKYYIIGFFLADGSYTNNGIKFDQNIDDKIVLDQIKQALQTNYKIATYKEQSTENYTSKSMCRLNISRIKFKQYLINFGIPESKTYNGCTFTIPKQYHKDFIRGFFDGDGSASYELDHRTKYVAFTIHDNNNANLILDILLNNNLNFNKEYSNIKNCYTLIIRKREEIEKFFNFIYTANDTMFLPRKKDKILQILNM